MSIIHDALKKVQDKISSHNQTPTGPISPSSPAPNPKLLLPVAGLILLSLGTLLFLYSPAKQAPYKTVVTEKPAPVVPAPTPTPAVVATPIIPTPVTPAIVVQGIMIQDNRPVVLINNEIYQQGDEISTGKIIHIDERFITVLEGKEEKKYRLRP